MSNMTPEQKHLIECPPPGCTSGARLMRGVWTAIVCHPDGTETHTDFKGKSVTFKPAPGMGLRDQEDPSQ